MGGTGFIIAATPAVYTVGNVDRPRKWQIGVGAVADRGGAGCSIAVCRAFYAFEDLAGWQ